MIVESPAKSLEELSMVDFHCSAMYDQNGDSPKEWFFHPTNPPPRLTRPPEAVYQVTMCSFEWCSEESG